MSLKQITAAPEVCQQLVDLGITPKAFFWHLLEPHPEFEEDENGAIKMVWDTFQLDGPEYERNIVVPAWTMEELNVMLGGDYEKPDLAPQQYVQVKSEPVNKRTYFEYKFGIFDLKGAKIWRSGAQGSAELLADALKRSQLKIDIVNERYSYFFKP